ncbi:MAG: hypothetical protein M9899_04070 [Bdellovibrionaceae bacterium]|nr:hypothetical protein [Pseudobdellovibrionaceae bacterium]
MSLPKSIRFLGVALSGVKTPRTSMAIVEYYPATERYVLAHIYDQITSKDDHSPDHVLIEYITKTSNVKSIHIDVPLQLPKTILNILKGQSTEVDHHEELRWMKNFYSQEVSTKKLSRSLSPYTERVAELYWKNKLDEKFILDHAGGANKAPLMFRAMYLNHLLPKYKMYEFYPKVSVWQIGRAYKVAKSVLRSYAHSVYGQESREQILTQLEKHMKLFSYDVEKRKMLKDINAFNAFVGALTGVYHHNKLIHTKDLSLPKATAWPHVPLEKKL